MTVLNPQYLQTKGYTSKQDRQILESTFDGEGVMGTVDLKPAALGTLTMTVAAGECTVRGDTNADQGLYHCRNDASITKTHTAHNATLPRLDQVVMHVYDSTEAGGVSNLADVEIVDGTATAGATLDNRNGATALPASAMLIADVLVPATSGSITVRDRRPYATSGAIPATKTVVDMVVIESPYVPLSNNTTISHGAHDLDQAACLHYLPRRIVGATRIRWKYVQDATTAITGNYNIGIYDASGRQIVTTGSVAFTGATATIQNRSETISATTFEAGAYYVWFGVDTGAGSAYTIGALMTNFNSGAGNTPNTPNVGLVASGAGGVTAPTTILGLVDANTLSVNIVPVPHIAFSIG